MYYKIAQKIEQHTGEYIDAYSVECFLRGLPSDLTLKEQCLAEHFLENILDDQYLEEHS